MPYFVFQITKGTDARVRDVQLLDQFEQYKQAKVFAREQRIALDVKNPGDVKIMFADDQEFAEQKLMEQRNAPILREWEK